MENKEFHYKKALPVWGKDYAKEKNVTISFSASVDYEKDAPAILYASAACSFTAFVNGKLITHGPARTAHGFFRVDEIDLAPHLKGGENSIVIRVTGYNVDSFAYLDQAPFFCSEIAVGDRIVAATGVSGFSAHLMTEKVQRVQRYSYQRPFVEVYRLAPGAFSYESDASAPEIALEEVGERCFLTRSAPYGDYIRIYPKAQVGGGSVAYSEKETYYNNRSISSITETDEQFLPDPNKDGLITFCSKGFRTENLEFTSFREVGMMDFIPEETTAQELSSITLPRDRYVDLDLGANETGLFSFEIEAHDECDLFLLFDEVMKNGALNPFRIKSAANIFALTMKPGRYTVVSAEPYTGKYLRLVAKGGAVTVKDLHVIEIAFPMSEIRVNFKGDDAQMKRIYDAAIRTFRANTVDIYMDCPSRERAGWLCDSFFTSRVEKLLTGRSAVELDFLEAFILRDTFPTIPDKMLPMCYPSDHKKGEFIPNWAMWYVLELREYLNRTGDRAFIDRARHTVLHLTEWFAPFENEDVLLEKLDGWVFVEWSMANKLVQDVSYASNMLYASFLDAVGELYGLPEMTVKAERIRDVIRKTAIFNGYFCDNAVRDEDGKLVLSGECTEACQYYAFFTGVATPESHPELWETLVNDFGFDRRTTKKHPEIHFANAFIGNYLRLELLARYGYTDMLERNIRDYFTYMAEQTGTLWEYEQDNKSCNHGFASHVLYWMDLLGYIER